MSGRVQVFAALRRRKQAIARVVLPLLATVWFSAGASLCFAMTAGPARPDHAAHEHHEHHERHEHHEHAGGPAAAEHRACPHCPPSASTGHSPPKHIGCSVLDDLADSGSAAKPLKLQLAYAFTAARFDWPVTNAAADPFRTAPSPRLVPSAVRLNVRHCVFLI